ncbi:MAG TPA: lipoyl(octanoyl) transferase LipB [Dehalococcoidia bacterium]|nr:lipoyl(octanoyl) transferase LipB [Dehalococcoidia bacterium]
MIGEAVCGARWLGRMEYLEAWRLQQALAQERVDGLEHDILLLLEHPPTYTIGRGGDDGAFLTPPAALEAMGAAVHHVDRGGRVTFHGPGQLVGYPIIDLSEWRQDVHAYLRALEEVLIATLAGFGLIAGRKPGYTGVWVGDEKIGAIGVKVSRWVTTHGFALNVTCDLDWFGHIVPCGLRGTGVTSLERAGGGQPPLRAVAEQTAEHFGRVFGRRMVWLPDLVATKPAHETDPNPATPVLVGDAP